MPSTGHTGPGSEADDERLASGMHEVSGWRACWATCTGPKHVRDSKPREDAVAVRGTRGALVVAVSDGHGMKAAFRAHIGASIAVDVATEEALTRRKRWRPAVDDEGAAVWLSRDFTAAVVGGWRRRVRQHRATHPFTSDELSFGGYVAPHSATLQPRGTATSDDDRGAESSEGVDLNDAEGLVAYGATLLVAMATGRRVLAWQLGDGDLIAAVNAQPAGPAVPGDPQLFGNRTTSLCLPGAEDEVRSSVLRLDDAPTLLVAASDGYGNAMVAEDWQARLGSDLHAMLVSDSFPDIAQRLPGWALAASSASGDDVTVALLVSGNSGAGSGALPVPPGSPPRPGTPARDISLPVAGQPGAPASLAPVGVGRTRVQEPDDQPNITTAGWLSSRLRTKLLAAIIIAVMIAGTVFIVGMLSSHAPTRPLPTAPTRTAGVRTTQPPSQTATSIPSRVCRQGAHGQRHRADCPHMRAPNGDGHR